MILYKIHRLLVSLCYLPINKLIMLVNHVKCSGKFHICGCLYIRNCGNIELGRSVYINSHRVANPIGGDIKTMLICDKGGKIILEDGVSISNSTLFATKGITVGENTCIGSSTKIYDTDFHSIDPAFRLHGNINVPSKPVNIGKRCFIGGHSIILKGVSIGDEAVIAAGSVVTKDVPSGEVWGGNPAKFLKKV